jgi:hypothetical protein
MEKMIDFGSRVGRIGVGVAVFVFVIAEAGAVRCVR